MLSSTFSRSLIVATVLALGVAITPHAQTAAPASPARGTLEELLSEVRSLRTEIKRATDASIRAQLLVARLQVQEQRIVNVSKQLGDVERQLSDNEKARSAMTSQLAMFTGEQHKQSAEDQAGFELIFRPLKAQLDLLEKSDGELRVQQTTLTNLIAEEQSRWATFNALLDELSKAIDVKPGR